MDWNVFRSEGLAKALTDAGYDVSARTIDRWKSGTSKPSKGQLRAIAELLGDKERAAPSMTERLELIEAILRSTALVSGVTPAELEAIEEAHQRALVLRRSQQQSGGRNPKGGRHPAGT
jgi:hypothetical protein